MSETRPGEEEAVEVLTKQLMGFARGEGTHPGWGMSVEEIVAIVYPIVAAAAREDAAQQIDVEAFDGEGPARAAYRTAARIVRGVSGE